MNLQLGRFSFNKDSISYQLNGVIEHIGSGVNFGHYVSAWRGFDERSWFHFDDSEVFLPKFEVNVLIILIFLDFLKNLCIKKVSKKSLLKFIEFIQLGFF